AGGDPALDRRRGERPRHVRRSAHPTGQLGPAGKPRGGRSASLAARHPQHDPAGARTEVAVAPVPAPDRASLAAGAFQPYSVPCSVWLGSRSEELHLSISGPLLAPKADVRAGGPLNALPRS